MSAMVQTLSCPACQSVADFTAYESINVGEHPELLPALLRNQLFSFCCASCGQLTPVAYDTLYHDPDHRLMVWLIQDENESAPEPPKVAARGDYLLRRVFTPEELIEKAQLAQDDIDDRHMELFKLVVGRTLMKETPNLEGTLHYAGRIETAEPGLAFRVATADNVSAVAVAMKELTQFVSRHPLEAQNSGEWSVIDFNWAMRQVQRI